MRSSSHTQNLGQSSTTSAQQCQQLVIIITQGTLSPPGWGKKLHPFILRMDGCCHNLEQTTNNTGGLQRGGNASSGWSTVQPGRVGCVLSSLAPVPLWRGSCLWALRHVFNDMKRPFDWLLLLQFRNRHRSPMTRWSFHQLVWTMLQSGTLA